MQSELSGHKGDVSWNWFKTAHFESAQHSKTLYSNRISEAFPSIFLTAKYQISLASDLKLGSSLRKYRCILAFTYGRDNFGSHAHT